MPVRIKICGITQYEDARIATNLGVDALGFIFYPKSPRYIAPAQAAEITRRLPPFISRVGVFVDEEMSMLLEISQFAGIDTIQLHGTESPTYCKKIPYPVIKSFSIEPTSDLSLLEQYEVSGFLLDTWHAELRGGTGRTCNWTMAQRACMQYNTIILAGGLGPTNIEEALEKVNPFGVDINSGVEIKPGIKNPHKMREAINIAKKWK
jgi:phosphoribosylanthranilate isomerase